MKNEHWIEGPWKGGLAILPRPRGGDWLEDEVSRWQRSGIDVVVSLLTPDEVAEFGLEEEKASCEVYGIEFISFPIEDRGVPASELAATALVHRLDRSLARGQRIGVHCRQGLGRSALVAASLLVASSVEPKQAFDRVAAARGSSVPDTLEQERWLTERAPSFAVQPAR
jgi:protein-tyrosine phosphatase